LARDKAGNGELTQEQIEIYEEELKKCTGDIRFQADEIKRDNNGEDSSESLGLRASAAKLELDFSKTAEAFEKGDTKYLKGNIPTEIEYIKHYSSREIAVGQEVKKDKDYTIITMNVLANGETEESEQAGVDYLKKGDPINNFKGGSQIDYSHIENDEERLEEMAQDLMVNAQMRGTNLSIDQAYELAQMHNQSPLKTINYDSTFRKDEIYNFSPDKIRQVKEKLKSNFRKKTQQATIKRKLQNEDLSDNERSRLKNEYQTITEEIGSLENQVKKEMENKLAENNNEYKKGKEKERKVERKQNKMRREFTDNQMQKSPPQPVSGQQGRTYGGGYAATATGGGHASISSSLGGTTHGRERVNPEVSTGTVELEPEEEVVPIRKMASMPSSTFLKKHRASATKSRQKKEIEKTLGTSYQQIKNYVQKKMIDANCSKVHGYETRKGEDSDRLYANKLRSRSLLDSSGNIYIDPESIDTRRQAATLCAIARDVKIEGSYKKFFIGNISYEFTLIDGEVQIIKNKAVVDLKRQITDPEINYEEKESNEIQEMSVVTRE